jgi:biopolymer transport protein TolR
MVTAPMMTSGVNVDLPKTDAKPLNADSQPLTVSIQGDGKIFLQDNEIALPDLVTKLNAIAAGDMGRRIFVRGDKGIPYGQVMAVMGTIAQGGFTKVALLADASGVPSPAPAKPGG